MSYVLDALKRSEQDRKQGQVPNLNDQGALLHLAQPKKPLWPLVLIGVLVLNAGVFLYLHWSGQQGQAVSPSGNAGPTQAPTSPAAESPARRLNSTVGPAPSPSPVQGPEPTQTAAPVVQRIAEKPVSVADKNIDWAAREREAKRLIKASEQGGGLVAESAKAIRIDPQVASVSPDKTYDVIKPKAVPPGGALPFPESSEAAVEYTDIEPAPEQDYSHVPFLYEMDARQQPRVPKLKFNSHIYSDQPDARRVMINNIYLREGQSLSGLDVVQIGEANIVFKKGDALFKLPAMRDWEG